MKTLAWIFGIAGLLLLIVWIVIRANSARAELAIPSADFIAAAMKGQETASGSSLQVKYSVQALHVNDSEKPASKTLVTYIRTPEVVVLEERIELSKDSTNWEWKNTTRYSYSKSKHELRVLNTGPSGGILGIITNEFPGAQFSQTTLVETVSRFLPEKPLYEVVKRLV